MNKKLKTFALALATIFATSGTPAVIAEALPIQSVQLESNQFDITNDPKFIASKTRFSKDGANFTDRQLASNLIVCNFHLLTTDALISLDNLDYLNTAENLQDFFDVQDVLANIYEQTGVVIPASPEFYSKNDYAVLGYIEEKLATVAQMDRSKSEEQIFPVIDFTANKTALNISYNGENLVLSFQDLSPAAQMISFRYSHSLLNNMNDRSIINDSETEKMTNEIQTVIEPTMQALGMGLAQHDNITSVKKH